MRIIPPGSGIIHQVNLEYLARVVFDQDGYYYPDSLVGTDSHTTMIDGLGVLGWGECSPCVLYCSCALIYVDAIALKSMSLCDHKNQRAICVCFVGCCMSSAQKSASCLCLEA